jgi:putative SOS response-associated peptidase YedK
MPVILTRDDALAWFDPTIDDPKAMTALLKPFDAKRMICYPVRVAVGNVRNNNASLIEPIPA